METIQMIFKWSVSFLNSSSAITNALNTSIINGYTLLGFVTIGGLLAYLGIAIIKWLVS